LCSKTQGGQWSFLDLAYTFLLTICPHKLNTLSDEIDDPGKLKYFLASL